VSEVVVTAEVRIVDGHETEAMEVLEQLCSETHDQDEGCLLYALHRVVGDPTRVVLIERWASIEALEQHGTTAHAAAAMSHGSVEGPDVTILAAVPVGDHEKGQL
jgi:quinol monooxygenase YgiN